MAGPLTVTNPWSGISGRPFYVVSGGSTSTTGADFGSDTSDGTNGIQTALNQAANGKEPKAVYLLADKKYTVTSTISVPAHSRLIGWNMQTSFAYGDAEPSFVQYGTTQAYIEYTASSGACFLIQGDGTASTAFGVGIDGITVLTHNAETDTKTNAAFHADGIRNCVLRDCSFLNDQPGGAALCVSGTNQDAEHNLFENLSCWGDPAIQIGTTGTTGAHGGGAESGRPNDNTWINITAEDTVSNPTTQKAVWHIEGGNNYWVNFYQRRTVSPVVGYYLAAGTVYFNGCEWDGGAAGGVSHQNTVTMLNNAGGAAYLRDITFTQGKLVNGSGRTIGFIECTFDNNNGNGIAYDNSGTMKVDAFSTGFGNLNGTGTAPTQESYP